MTIFSMHITYIVTRYIHNKNRVLQDKVYFYNFSTICIGFLFIKTDLQYTIRHRSDLYT